MVVKPEDLTNPEQGVDLTTRDAKATKKLHDDIQRVKTGKYPSAEAELEAMRKRIVEAKKLTNGRPESYGRVSDFERGRDAAIRAIEGEQ